MTKGTDLSEMRVWITTPGKNPGSAEVLAEVGGNMEWVKQESSDKYQLRPCDQLQK